MASAIWGGLEAQGEDVEELNWRKSVFKEGKKDEVLRVSSTDGFAVAQIHTAPLSGSQNTNSNLQLLPSKQKVNDNLKKVHTHTHTHSLWQ